MRNFISTYMTRLGEELRNDDKTIEECCIETTKYVLHDFIENNISYPRDIEKMRLLSEMSKDIEKVISSTISEENSIKVIPFDYSLL